ncbi:uncharacterized protein LOC116019713 isoform X2 [Ipomoea triloba]|uniref:uncharacterized protein LOC116019713 isoform X2 n=1 Tax=Ipomoea triloba TaxID=35885 RepID=UPI00125E754D|nr:uncharacterized protein LOC116019713 isoform X2 [Ipomoea triloba]
MENGGGSLESKLAGLHINDSGHISGNNSDGLFQVMKAVEAAEATIKQQVEENYRLRSELQKKIQELEKYKSDELKSENSHSVEPWDVHHHLPDRAFMSNSHFRNQNDGPRNIDNTLRHTLSNNVVQNDIDSTIQTHRESRRESDNVNGTLRVLGSGQASSDPSGFSQFSLPSASSFSPSRYQTEGERDRPLNVSGQGLMPIAEQSNANSMKQDIVLQIRDQEQEISQLRKLLGEYAVKEAQISNEKYVLEKRIAYMRMAFDQQQQDLVDAASKAISYRQDIIEENIRLAYALQAAQQERTTFVSSLLPLLAEYSLKPLPDAQSIVGNIKILFRHLQEKLFITEAKLKESQFQMTPWSSDVNSNFALSPSDSAVIKDGLELVPQRRHSNETAPSSSDPQTGRAWDPSGNPPYDIISGATNGMEGNNLGSFSPFVSRNTVPPDASTQLDVSQDQSVSKSKSEEIPNKQVTFSELSNTNGIDDPDMEINQNDREPSVSWASKSSPYATALEDPISTYSPYLPPVLEEPTSSFSEDDDPLPAIEGLQIAGEAYPGRELQASGYSINGTTSCIFEWVRHKEDGSFSYIEEAKQPVYLVTADDVDTYLAIEVQPLDDRKRKGEAVKVFANEHRKITCDPDMQNCIERTLQSGHASFEVYLWTGYLDIWEPATLAIKRDGFSIKSSGTIGVMVTEKFSPSIRVSIPYGCPGEFSITDSREEERLLKANDATSYSSRDAIVLIMKYFILKAGEKRSKTRKKRLFFN